MLGLQSIKQSSQAPWPAMLGWLNKQTVVATLEPLWQTREHIWFKRTDKDCAQQSDVWVAWCLVRLRDRNPYAGLPQSSNVFKSSHEQLTVLMSMNRYLTRERNYDTTIHHGHVSVSREHVSFSRGLHASLRLCLWHASATVYNCFPVVSENQGQTN